MIAAVSGGCLIDTSVVMLLFYVKNYIGTHGKELGILKALGYSNIKIARHFWVFGLSVFVGSTIGFVVGYFYLPIVGCTLPILAKRVGGDPAVMASPFLTTIVDALSLIIYFEIAGVLLHI